MANLYSLLLLSSLLAAPVLANPALEKRLTCHRDNVFRALIDPRYSAQAVPFCSTYVSVPATVITVTETPAVTETVRFTATVYSAYTPSAALAKRHDTTALPTFVSQYPPSRVSSACSCLNTIRTLTVTERTVYVTPTRTLPALCNPTNFKEYRGAVDYREATQLRQVPGTTEQECCLSCWNTDDCVRFQFRPDNPQSIGCEYYVGLTQADPANRPDICPLGVPKGSYLDTPTPGEYRLNYGPCMEKAPLT